MSRALSLIFIAVFVAQAWIGMRQESVTFDEPASIGSAFLAFRMGDLSIVRERPPLLGLFISLPLILSGQDRLPTVGDTADRVADVKFGDQFLHDSGNDTTRILLICRIVVLLLTALMGFFLIQWAGEWNGSWGAVLAGIGFAFCPNLLAHSRIAANDIMLTVFTFFALFTFSRFVVAPGLSRAVVAGLFLGLGLGAKLSGVLILPIYLIFVWSRPKLQNRYAAYLFIAAAISLGISMGGRFDYASYFGGFSKIYSGTQPGYPFYLGGDSSTTPWWYYHAYAVFIKTPLSLLVLFGIGAYVSVRERTRFDVFFIAAAAIALFLGASFFDSANIGVRRVLPIFPFLILIASRASRFKVDRSAKAVALVLLAAWQILSVSRVFPHHLAYFNELVGGPSRGMYYLDDSNVDWGQELPGIRRWIDAHPGLPMRLSYFGMGRPATYGILIPGMEEGDICSPKPEIYIVSAHHVAFFEKMATARGTPQCSWLARYEPTDRIGYSIWIYDFRPTAKPSSRPRFPLPERN